MTPRAASTLSAKTSGKASATAAAMRMNSPSVNVLLRASTESATASATPSATSTGALRKAARASSAYARKVRIADWHGAREWEGRDVAWTLRLEGMPAPSDCLSS